MKLICPECGLKGTADESLLEKNIKCPGCETVFRLAGTVLVAGEAGHVGNSSGQGAADSYSGGETRECASCGFVLSEKYLTEVNGILYCRVCVAAAEQQKAA